MKELFKYRIRCITEDAWVEGWAETEPTECFNDQAHTIGDITIIETPGSIYLMTAGEDLDINKPVYISGSDEVKSAQADSELTIPCVGFTIHSALLGESVQIQTNGTLSGYTGLTPGVEYFLSQDTSGGIVDVRPTSGIIYSLGVARTSTELDIHLQQLTLFPEFFSAESEGEWSTTSASWQEKLDINTGGIPAGTYRFSWFYEWCFSRATNPGAGYGVHINWGAITLHEVNMVPSTNGIYGNGCFYSCSGSGEKSLSAGSHKMALNFKANGDDSTAYIRRARLTMWRVS